LHQYRQLLRAARKLKVRDEELARDTTTQIKNEFRRYQGETDKALVSVLLSDGEKQLKMIESLVGAAPNSWKGTVDEDGSDERGRVGQKWPWEN